MKNQAKSDILVVGGGLVGSAMALAAAKEGYAITLFEREPEGAALKAGYDGRVSAISEASVRVLKAIGVWDDLAAEAGPIRAIRVADGDSRAKVHFDHHELGEDPFGYMVENVNLRRVLAEQLAKNSHITVKHEAEVVAADATPGAARLKLHSGESYAAPLLLVADGRRSAVRTMLGIESRQIDYAQVAMVCTIRHSIPHEEVAVELFLPSGPLAVLPMSHQRACIVWTETKDRAPYYLEMPEAEFAVELHREMRGYLGEIVLIGKRHSYPLSLVQAKRYIAPRAALIGDSAHGIHPIAGQGVNLGYRDVAVMSELLAETRSLGLDHGSQAMLERYQRWRRFDATSMMLMTDGLNRLFSTERLPFRLARRLGMSAFDRVMPVKRFFMLNAMGLSVIYLLC